MRNLMVLTACLLSLSWTAPTQAQKGKIQSPAELFPADTLVYAELQKPGQLAMEVRELFKGSYLYDVPSSLEELEAKNKKNQIQFGSSWWMTRMGMMLAPELVSELQQMQGAAVGFTKFPTGAKGDDEGEWVVVILPGTSNLPTFGMRALLSANARKVGAEEGVSLYRTVIRNYRFDPPFEEIETGPTMALMPNLILIGTSDAVKQTIKRALGKAEGETLASTKIYQEVVAKVGGKPGLFAFANVPKLMEIVKNVPNIGPEEKIIFDALFDLANPKAFQTAFYSITLEKGTLSLQESVLLDPNEKSQLLELYPSAPFNTDLLKFAAKDSFFAGGISNNDGEQRFEKVVGLLNKLLPPDFNGLRVSDYIQKLEKQLDIDLGKDVAGAITNVAFIMGDPLSAPVKKVVVKGENFTSTSFSPEIPMLLVVETQEDKAVQKLLSLVPRIAGMAGKDQVKPGEKMVNGHKVTTLQISPDYTLGYAQVGNTLVIGPYPDAVGQAVDTAAKNSGLGGDKALAARFKELDSPFAVGVARPMLAFVGASASVGFSEESHSAEAIPSKSAPIPPPQPKKDEKDFEEIGVKDGPGQNPKVTRTVTIEQDTEMAKIRKEMAPIFAKESWMVMTASRNKDHVKFEATVPNLQKVVPAMTNYVLEKAVEMRASFGAGAGEKADAPLAVIEDAASKPPEIKEKK
jgi:hypothetical protein